MHGFFCFTDLLKLNESLPDFSFLKDQYFDDCSIRRKHLIKIVMRNDISELIVGAHQQDSALIKRVIATPHCRQI